MTRLLSNTISGLRTILCMLIVFLHMQCTALTWQDLHIRQFPVYYSISTFFTLLTQLAVPLFFIISGYLFFISYTPTVACYKNKIKTRARHLLQPLFIWTTVYLLLYFIAQQIPYTAGLFSGQNKLIADYNWMDFINAYTGILTGLPFAGQYWFLRNLFILCLLAPLFRFLFQYTQWAILSVIGVVWYFHAVWQINQFFIYSLFFFTLGSYLGWSQTDVLQLFGKWKTAVSVLFPVSWMMIFALSLAASPLRPYLYGTYILLGVVFMFNTCAWLLKKGHGQKLLALSAGSYFCFLLHQQLLMFIKRLAYKLIDPHNSITLTALYFLVSITVIMLCYALYNYLKRTCPKVLKTLVGESINNTR